MLPYPGSLYLCLVGIATAAALVCVVCAGEVRLDTCLWLAIAVVASVLYFVSRTASPSAATASWHGHTGPPSVREHCQS
jgi:hypothetical protein